MADTTNVINNQTVNAGFVAGRNLAGAGQIAFSAAVHSDTTNAGSDATVIAQATSTSGADAYFQAALSSTRTWGWGIDASDSAKYKEFTTNAGSSNPSTGTITRVVTTTGIQTLPLQPAFFANLTVSATNATGAGAIYFLGNNSGGTTTVVTDRGSNTSFVAGKLTFTAPSTSFYVLGFSFGITGITALMTDLIGSIFINGSVGFLPVKINPANLVTPAVSNGFGVINGSGARLLTAGDAVTFYLQTSGAATNTQGVDGTSTTSYAWGYLVC